jgi:hypothetical protein
LIRLIRATESAIPPATGTHPPTYPYPDPRGVTGNPRRFANASTARTCSALRAKTTTSGSRLANHLSAACAARTDAALDTLSAPTSDASWRTSALELNG